jgi:hypothetical protein
MLKACGREDSEYETGGIVGTSIFIICVMANLFGINYNWRMQKMT